MSDPWGVFPTCWNCEHELTDADLDAGSETRCPYCDAEIEIIHEAVSERMGVYLDINFDRSWYDEYDRTMAERSAYLRGLAAGFCVFAWWKDGIQYVGSCGTKLIDAMGTIREELNRLGSTVVAPAVPFPGGADDDHS